MKEHSGIKKSSKSEVKTPINSYHCRRHATYNSFEVIKKFQNNFSTLIHEALIIRHKDPTLNKQLYQRGSSFTLKIFALSYFLFVILVCYNSRFYFII